MREQTRERKQGKRRTGGKRETERRKGQERKGKDNAGAGREEEDTPRGKEGDGTHVYGVPYIGVFLYSSTTK